MHKVPCVFRKIKKARQVGLCHVHLHYLKWSLFSPLLKFQSHIINFIRAFSVGSSGWGCCSIHWHHPLYVETSSENSLERCSCHLGKKGGRWHQGHTRVLWLHFPDDPGRLKGHPCEEGWEDVSLSCRCLPGTRLWVVTDSGSFPIPVSSVYPEMLTFLSEHWESSLQSVTALTLFQWKQFTNRFSLHRLFRTKGQVWCLIVPFQWAACCWLAESVGFAALMALGNGCDYTLCIFFPCQPFSRAAHYAWVRLKEQLNIRFSGAVINGSRLGR